MTPPPRSVRRLTASAAVRRVAVAGLVGVATLVASQLASRPAGAAPAPATSDLVALAPVGPSSAWALTAGQTLHGWQVLARTQDAGAQWSTVTPPGLARQSNRTSIESVDVLGPARAWLTVGGPRHSVIEATSDGGARWRRLGVAPGKCTPQFINARDGWCVALYGAAGSEGVAIARTVDGGYRWRSVSYTGPPGVRPRSTPAALPFACDKAVRFTSPRDGWASSQCAGSEGYVYSSDDAGARWQRRLAMAPSHGVSDGAQFTAVVARGRDVVVGLTEPGYHHPGRTTVYRSLDGGAHWTTIAPPRPDTPYHVEIVTPSVWRLVAGHTVLATDDAGRSWTTTTADTDLGRASVLTFTGPQTGWEQTFSGADPLRYTADGGAHWAPVPLPAHPK